MFDREWRHLEDVRRNEIRGRRDAYERRFRGLIEDGIATGEFVAVDPSIASAFLLTALNARRHVVPAGRPPLAGASSRTPTPTSRCDRSRAPSR